MTPKKQCSSCHILKPLEAFGSSRGRPDGKNVYCKECVRGKGRERYSKNAYEISKYRADAKTKDPERFSGYWKKYNIEKHDRKIDSQKRYRESHKAELIESGRLYRENNPGKRKATCAAWAKNNPEKANAITERRRSRKLGLDLGFSVNDWRSVKRIFGDRCCYCGGVGKLTQDHFVPLCKDGPHVIWNIVPACMPCNYKKNRHHPLDWVVKNYGKRLYNSIAGVLGDIKSGKVS